MHSKEYIYIKGPQIKENKYKKNTFKFFIFQKNWSFFTGSAETTLIEIPSNPAQFDS